MSNQYEYDSVNCVGKGWHPLVQPLIDRCKQEGVEIHQIKEKFGGLRFYTGPCSEELDSMIAAAEHQSLVTCEGCGAPGTRQAPFGWIKTVCEPCKVEWESARKNIG